jgi:hypothetical protein
MVAGNYASAEVQSTRRLNQFKIIYDYVKFLITLYLSTPAVMALIGKCSAARTATAPMCVGCGRQRDQRDGDPVEAMPREGVNLG